MIKANQGPAGVVTSTYNLGDGGLLQDARKFMPYKTPYQQKFGGRFVKFAKATTYDSSISAANDYIVIVPCSATGEMPDGITYMTTRRTDLLEGAAAAYLPEDAYVAGSGYATSEGQFAKVTLVPLTPGELISVPVGAYNIAIGAKIATDANGFATTAASTNYVLGTAAEAVNNSTGTAGAKFVTVMVTGAYPKA